MPDTFIGRPVVDGDKSDLDNVRAGRVIIGLIEKKSGNEDADFMVSPNDVVDINVLSLVA
jgi:hypothetical protein